MRSSHHILTVGVSLLTNFAKANGRPLDETLRSHKQLTAYLKADPRAACAEINSLDARAALLRHKNQRLAVTLVYSATPGRESGLTARLIGNFLKLRGIPVSEVKLKDIDIPSNASVEPSEAAALAARGLSELGDKIKRHVHKLRKQDPKLAIEFNATGGFKAETAILYGVGCALGIPVYYMHERYKVPIVLPNSAVPA